MLRNLEIDEIEEDCATGLFGLEILSLSHNKLTSLRYFENLSNLLELNVNFNALTSLEGLACPNLTKLFASNNQIFDISSLKQFSALETLSLFGNQLPDLDEVIATLRNLKLRKLDLDGNPASRIKGYKYRVLRGLPKLEELDGEPVTSLDKEMTEDFIATSRNVKRPSTAPARQSTLDSVYNSMPHGNVRLFRSNFLNNHPILLEYLAADALDHSSDGGSKQALEQITEEYDAIENPPVASKFVDKLRTSAPATNPTQVVPVENNDEIKFFDVKPREKLMVDPSDPYGTIRKLLKMVQVLHDERETLLEGQSSSRDVNGLIKENERLRIENNNIPLLQEENKDLRKKLQSQSGGGAQNDETTELREELDRANRTIVKLKAKLTDKNKEQTPHEVLDEAAEFDEEISELMMRNEVALQQIKMDIRKTQREYRTAGRRPSTACGRF